MANNVNEIVVKFAILVNNNNYENPVKCVHTHMCIYVNENMGRI